ncbi:serine O-acetyltransferase [Anseongella ginsenosidimutans]|uniref:Serine O-acetyltransferase n=1 Tax=Anseongella ginsenosidimutans TaxID=496056 RepID=A0A4R3KPG9_9SPHI|nr:serine O-acetyltransferase [Anseongella ginsenosidimutans]QEC52652.1 serine acetyltransferase [Anseongella ginsenosidimutans]TCS86578.1 serine O-acetyltransferase [Anseongella ginsenosidimutans]
MNRLLEELAQRHRNAAVNTYPSSERICDFSRQLMNLLFPEHNGKVITSPESLGAAVQDIGRLLEGLLLDIQPALPGGAANLAGQFMEALPDIYRHLVQDAEAIHLGDPASSNPYEVIRAYPGFYAIGFYRIAHVLYGLNIPLLPRIITEFAHAKTGIDIHPAASIGSHFCIDHGTGAVIGETTVIGDYVKIYQGVTLGAASVDKAMAKSKRHPTIEDHVVIYSGATILGGETTVGHHSVIGGNVWLIKSVPPYSRIYYRSNDVTALT